MYATPLTDRAYAVLFDAWPLEDGLDERIRAALSSHGATRLSLQNNRAEAENVLSHAVSEVVYNRLDDVVGCELVPIAGAVDGVKVGGHLVRVCLPDFITLTAALWSVPSDAVSHLARVSPCCEAFLIDEAAHTYLEGHEVLGLAAAARALRLVEGEPLR